MLDNQTPKWLQFLEKKIGWFSFPNMALTLVGLQAIGFLLVMQDSNWIYGLYLNPELVLQGEVWRIMTFLALPLSTHPLWVIFVLWILYFIVNVLETQWGTFKTTFYIAVSYFLMLIFSFVFAYPITNISHFESTLFLAAAALIPNYQFYLFFVLPVKLKWLAWLTIILVVINFINSSWLDRFYLLAIYANYVLFFGPAFFKRIKRAYHRKKYKDKL